MADSIRNVSRDLVLAKRSIVARRFWTRFRGMIGRDFSAFDAMVFPNCSSVHTFWMSRPIDLVYLDRDDRVLGIRADAKPWRTFFGARGTRTIVEMAAGTLSEDLVREGDQLAW